MSKGLEYLTSPTKRAHDILGALALGIGGWPAAAVGAALLKHELDVPWNQVIFKQQRRGKGGEPFTIYKLLTMPPTDGPTVTYGTHDPRAGAYGSVIRRWGIDEIPQVWNILRGDMSLIAPRTLLEQDHNILERADPVVFKDWQQACDEIRGGVYAPSQNLRRAHAEHTYEMWAECMRLDLEYIETATFAGDMQLMLTAPYAIARALRAGRTSS
jgi:lipopolysaccharide/colanic/teichoic acid biosynthesis glycosyltransferase